MSVALGKRPADGFGFGVFDSSYDVRSFKRPRQYEEELAADVQWLQSFDFDGDLVMDCDSRSATPTPESYAKELQSKRQYTTDDVSSLDIQNTKDVDTDMLAAHSDNVSQKPVPAEVQPTKIKKMYLDDDEVVKFDWRKYGSFRHGIHDRLQPITTFCDGVAETIWVEV